MPALGLPLALPYLNYTYARGGGGGAATAPADDDFGSVEALVPMRSIQTINGSHTFDFVYGNRWEEVGDVAEDAVNTLFDQSTMEFDGSSDYFVMDVSDYTTITGPRFDPTEDFTVEIHADVDTIGTHAHILFSKYGNGASGVRFRIDGSGNLACDVVTSSGIETATGSTTLSVDTWYHLAATLDGSTLRVFVDGALDGSATLVGTPIFDSTVDAYIGRDPGEGVSDIDGNLANFRWTQGIARYTASFTAPTEPYPTQTEVGTDANWANVILLIQPDDEADGSTTITDESGTATAITAFNNTKITRADPLLFGLGSNIYNDDVGDNSRFEVAMPAGPDTLDGDFTIEMWSYFFNPGSTDYKLESADALPLFMRWGAFHAAGPGNDLISETTTSQAAEGHRWQYEALVRSGSTLSYYWNGQLEGTVTETDNVDFSDIVFGWDISASGGAFDGHFGPIRITKGVARDVTTVPTAPFPTSGP